MYPIGLSKQRWLQTSLQGLGTGRGEKKKKKSVIKAAEEVIRNIPEILQGIPYQTPKFRSLDQFFKTSDAQTPKPLAAFSYILPK